MSSSPVIVVALLVLVLVAQLVTLSLLTGFLRGIRKPVEKIPPRSPVEP